jgi:hypothetical protein
MVILPMVRWTWNEGRIYNRKRCNLTYYNELNGAFRTHENPFLREPESTSSQKRIHARLIMNNATCEKSEVHPKHVQQYHTSTKLASKTT